MSLFRIQLTVDKLLIIFLNIAHVCSFQQVVTGIHFHTDWIQRLHYLGYIRNDSIFPIGQLGKEVMFNHRIDTEFNFLRVYQHKLQFSRMLLIKQRSDDGIQSDRFTLTGGTGHQHMRHLAQINHENLIGNRLAQSYRQVISRLLELLATDDTLSGNNLRIGVRYFNTDCSFSRNRCNDTNTQCRKAESDIIFQTTNLGNTNPLLGGNFIQRHRRSHRRLYRTDFNTETAQCIYNLIFIGILLRHVDSRLGIIIMLHQVDSRITIVFQI